MTPTFIKRRKLICTPDNNERSYFDDFKEGNIDGNNSQEIKQLLNERYLSKNYVGNDEKCYDKLNYKDIKGKIHGNNLKTTEQSTKKKLI